MWGIVVFLVLIVRGGDTISMLGIMFLFKTGLGEMIPRATAGHVSRSARVDSAGSCLHA